MNLNNGFEDAALTAEIGIFEAPANTLSATASETRLGLLGQGPVGAAIGAVYIDSNATFAASDANYWQFQVYKRTAGGAGVLIAQGSTSATVNSPIGGGSGVTAWVPAALNVVAGAFISPLDVVTIIVTKVGTPANITYGVLGVTTIK